MGKKKWRRVRLADLGKQEEKNRLLVAMDQAKGQPKGDSTEKQAPENPATGR
jgi:hypothetical protein